MLKGEALLSVQGDVITCEVLSGSAVISAGADLREISAGRQLTITAGKQAEKPSRTIMPYWVAPALEILEPPRTDR